MENQTIINCLKEFVTQERYARICDIIEKRTRHFTIVVENLYQSHNMSAILRTAECLGIQDVHIIENNYEYEISKQVALGAQKWLSIYRYNQRQNNTLACLKAVKEKGYKIIATLPHKNDCLPNDIPIDEKTAFVFGTELDGLTREAVDMADGFVKIPMYGFTESYNVSVSVALTMYAMNERLRASALPLQLSHEEKLFLQADFLKKSVKDSDRILKRLHGT
ncbi:MAG: RNA methyltransferase [Bacteroidales bacterium]|nr:RNA methyltransferase [Bacteroidales bacterium]